MVELHLSSLHCSYNSQHERAVLGVQGSEVEVQALQAVDLQPRLVVEAQRKRRHYGGPAEFNEESAGMLLDLFPRLAGRAGASQASENSDGASQTPDIQMLEQDMGTQVSTCLLPLMHDVCILWSPSQGMGIALICKCKLKDGLMAITLANLAAR